ncbi:DUF58 domain-containing protein [Aureibacter tunicatorum]|uniref:Uncharacterized protein (DUF58 family) n=1 Tax=Aureibacter tunicatorum TaxID=866807 RepID=A0AAE3XNK9_9BACT|nr:DUF58 domain-containing protein [Aureibacter tunicatorum]MDR6241221.1 uncharacterized protein (DUF58 family) [Aureibacter tunicatorum]BDD03482.1 hypothetical protein AUTU_09650 [Aureibacter tunicatorum]
MKEIFQKLRNYEIKIRKAIKSHMQGDFHSIFRGSGIEFDDVRVYQYGDDVRAIDWKVSAKGVGTYVKTYKEDKEQNVMFLIDVSASQDIGKKGSKKMDIAKEICGVLTLSATKENSSTGLICYSDQKELYIKPNKGMRHAYESITKLHHLQPKSRKTNLNDAIKFTLNFLKRRSIVILISDFIDEDYQHQLKGLAGSHDLVVIHITDTTEANLPKLGIIPLFDKESQSTIWVNTSSNEFREKVYGKFSKGHNDLQELCLRNQADYLKVITNQEYVSRLIKLFKIRNKTKKRAR